MTTSHNPAANDTHPRPAASRRTRRNAVLALYAALAVQVAAWIAIALHVSSVKAAFTQPHPGFPANLLPGGAIWLVMFAMVVVLCHKRALGRSAG